MQIVSTELDKMIAEDIIEYSCSPYTSPLIAVAKKDGKVRDKTSVWMLERSIRS